MDQETAADALFWKYNYSRHREILDPFVRFDCVKEMNWIFSN